MVGRWGVGNRLRSRSEKPSHSTASGRLVSAGESFRSGGYLGLVQMDPVQDRELSILQEPGMGENLKKRINACL